MKLRYVAAIARANQMKQLMLMASIFGGIKK